jgi:hypothetical protein
MTSWLDPVVSALDRRPAPVEIFVRDDDGGWEDGRLLALLDLFAEERFPIDVAAIPAATGEALAAELSRRMAFLPLGIHQHGFTHLNHEPEGRACEFGRARPIESQHSDIRLGRQMLLDQFGAHLDPIFTPPWNRCTVVTALCLRDIGIRAISRDVTAGWLRLDGLVECPIGVDWFARRGGQRLSRAAWAEVFAGAIDGAAGPLGVMLHHAVMGSDELRAWSGVLRVLAGHSNASGMLMREAIGRSVTGRKS